MERAASRRCLPGVTKNSVGRRVQIRKPATFAPVVAGLDFESHDSHLRAADVEECLRRISQGSQREDIRRESGGLKGDKISHLLTKELVQILLGRSDDEANIWV